MQKKKEITNLFALLSFRSAFSSIPLKIKEHKYDQGVAHTQAL